MDVGNPGQSFLASASPVVLITQGTLTILSAARRSTHSPVFAMVTGVTFLGLHLLGPVLELTLRGYELSDWGYELKEWM